MRDLLTLFSAFVVLIFSFGCKKEEAIPNLWDCHHQQTWDSTATAQKLLGTWNWQYSFAENYEDLDKTASKGLEVTFKPDGNLEVYDNGQLTQTAIWKVQKGDGDLFEIEVNPGVSNLFGRILFCNDQAEFNNSYLDGEDNYFKRK